MGATAINNPHCRTANREELSSEFFGPKAFPKHLRTTKLQAALHEAGHATAALLAYPPKYVSSLSINETQHGWEGFCDDGDARWQSYLVPAYEACSVEHKMMIRHLAIADCIVYLSGPVAELRWKTRSRLATQLYGRFIIRSLPIVLHPDSDLERVRTRLHWLFGANILDEFAALWDRAERLIAAHWSGVLELGRLLADAGSLDETALNDWICRQSRSEASHRPRRPAEPHHPRSLANVVAA